MVARLESHVRLEGSNSRGHHIGFIYRDYTVYVGVILG